MGGNIRGHTALSQDPAGSTSHKVRPFARRLQRCSIVPIFTLEAQYAMAIVPVARLDKSYRDASCDFANPMTLAHESASFGVAFRVATEKNKRDSGTFLHALKRFNPPDDPSIRCPVVCLRWLQCIEATELIR